MYPDKPFSKVSVLTFSPTCSVWKFSQVFLQTVLWSDLCFSKTMRAARRRVDCRAQHAWSTRGLSWWVKDDGWGCGGWSQVGGEKCADAGETGGNADGPGGWTGGGRGRGDEKDLITSHCRAHILLPCWPVRWWRVSELWWWARCGQAWILILVWAYWFEGHQGCSSGNQGGSETEAPDSGEGRRAGGACGIDHHRSADEGRSPGRRAANPVP